MVKRLATTHAPLSGSQPCVNGSVVDVGRGVSDGCGVSVGRGVAEGIGVSVGSGVVVGARGVGGSSGGWWAAATTAWCAGVSWTGAAARIVGVVAAGAAVCWPDEPRDPYMYPTISRSTMSPRQPRQPRPVGPRRRGADALTGPVRLAPQRAQKRPPRGFLVPHCGQVISPAPSTPVCQSLLVILTALQSGRMLV